MVQKFNAKAAKEFGLLAAFLLEYFNFWIKVNSEKGINYYDGCYWTFNNISNIAANYPYVSQRAVYTAVQKLIQAKIIKTGNYNRTKYDRTLWYALDTNASEYISEDNEDTKMVNGCSLYGEINNTEANIPKHRNDKPIPVIYTVNNTAMTKRIVWYAPKGFHLFGSANRSGWLTLNCSTNG